MDKVFVLDAPSNLGLSPPEDNSFPGCYKLPWALRNNDLLKKINAFDGGCVIPPRYNAHWSAGEGDRNADNIASYSITLANSIETHIKVNHRLLVLGGDCSILIGCMLALKRLGRFGLLFFDAHSDFRHPSNSATIGAAAGEDLAIITKRGDNRLINLENLGPYVLDEDINLIGVRNTDECLSELQKYNIGISTSQETNFNEAKEIVTALNRVTKHTDGFWVHLDMDVVDSTEMLAVDCPEPNGLSFNRLGNILKIFISSPKFIGIDLTIYDPDLDPNGDYAKKITDLLTKAFT